VGGTVDDRSVENIKSSEQRRRPMSAVIVRLPLRQARSQGQDGLSPFQGLDLALFIHAQNYGPVWRIHIESHDVAAPGRERWVVAKLESLQSMRL
jgi:hypothetical protein